MKQQSCKFLLEDGTKCGSIFHTAMYHKPKKPRKKKTSKAILKKKLETLVKDYVKIRDNYTCQRCGKKVEGTNCHASHVIPVSRSGRLQFDPLNMKVLCYHDHINWWHKHPVEAGQWFTDTFPDRWAYLEAIHKEPKRPIKEVELQEMIDKYTALLK
jgi:5-methylcytosine-specific restriction endonuclease McrA